MCALRTEIHFITLVAVVFVLRRVIPPDTMRKVVSVANTETGVYIGTSHATAAQVSNIHARNVLS
jgi:uncharacterized membrane protein YadS